MRTLPFIALMLTTLSVAPTFAKAGAGSSGGGNALVCFDTPEIPKQIRERDQAGNIIDGSIRNEHINHITKVEVLDLVEAQFPRGMSQPMPTDLILPTSGEDVEEYAKRIIGRFKDVAPLLYEHLMARINEMPASDAVAQPDGLYPVDDYNLLGRIDSTNCVVATVAVHQFSGGAPVLYFDQRLMFHSKHSDVSRAITYLHEVVYSYARSDEGHTDSQDTRKLIGVMLRENLTVDDISKAIEENSFNNYNKYKKYFNFTEFMYSDRTDRLGYWYANLNLSVSNKTYKAMNFFDYEGRKEAREKFNAKMISDLSPLVDSSFCHYKSSYDSASCLFSNVREIANSSAGFSKSKKEKIKSAKILVEKYSNYEEKRIKFTNDEVTPALQKTLKDLYKDAKEELFSITNVDQDKLKEIDSQVASMIENNIELIKSRATDDNREIFLEVTPLVKKIPLQTKL